MERKVAFATVAVLLLLSLVFSPLLVVPVKAYGYDEGYGSASVMHACDADPTTPTELQYMYWAFDDIYNLYAERYHYYWVWYYYPYIGFWVRGERVYGHVTHSMVWNNGDPYSTTTVDNVLNGIDDVEDNHEYASFLYVGHTSSWYDEVWDRWRYGFYMNGKDQYVGGGQVPSVSDATIRLHAEDNHHFVFLWVCRCGAERGSQNNPPDDPPNGMPHCWTQGLIGQSDNGYDWPDGSNYCFIGFDGASPRLEEEQNGPDHLYKHWLVFFYYFALVYSYECSVNQALDHASWMQGFADFAQDRLYRTGPYYPLSGGDPEYMDTHWLGTAELPEDWYDVWMRVYGDGNYHIPGDIYHP